MPQVHGADPVQMDVDNDMSSGAIGASPAPSAPSRSRAWASNGVGKADEPTTQRQKACSKAGGA